MVDFVLLSGRLISVFVEDVAGYIESGLHREKAGSKMPAAVRKATKEPTKAHCRQPNLVWRSNDRFGFY